MEINQSNWKGKRVLITGACGTIGQELIRQVLEKDVEYIIGIDNNESNLFFLSEDYRNNPKVGIFLCDIRDISQLRKFFVDVNIVLHTAALKHVIINEYSPMEAIKTNIIGTQNIIDISIESKVERVIFTSSDKAVNPTNVMGTSKLMGERLITAANIENNPKMPIFASTRFGNVLGSNGSVIPLFKKQIQNQNDITLTDPEMSRFIMTIEEAVSLVTESVFMAKGGEVFVTKMPTIKIADLAEVMLQKLDDSKQLGIKVIGTKPGEKLYEELMNEEEVRRTLELQKYFVVLPALKSSQDKKLYQYSDLISDNVTKVYRSDLENNLNQIELMNYLTNNNLI